MLKDINADTNTTAMDEMQDNPSSSDQQVLTIHNTNLYQPHDIGITSMSISENQLLVASRRGYLKAEDINHPFSFLDLHEFQGRAKLRHISTYTEYEDISELVWLDKKHLLSVSHQSTINIYDTKTSDKVKVLTTDFGAIMCCKYLADLQLLVTGTEQGILAIYKIEVIGMSIELLDRLPRAEASITALDYYMKKLEKPPPVVKRKNPMKQAKRKRKKHADSSDESESDDEAMEVDTDPLNMYEIILYGAHKSNVSVWDLQKKKVLDTIKVENEVLAVTTLANGDVILGDSEGYIGIFDKNTLTCRQSEKLFDGSILSIAVNCKSSKILATGYDAELAILEVDKTSEALDEYNLFEKLRAHGAPITCAAFTSKKDFLTASYDSRMISFKIERKEGKKILNRHIARPSCSDKVLMNNQELLLVYGKSLSIHTLENMQSSTMGNITCPYHIELPAPPKGTSVRAGRYVQSAAFDEKWICYSTNRGVFIHRRSNIKERQTTDSELPNCHLMKLTADSRYLIACQRRKLYVIKLSEKPSDSYEENGETSAHEVVDSKEGQSKKMFEHEIIFGLKATGYIREILHMPQTGRLIALSGMSTKNCLYQFKLPTGDNGDGEVFLESKVNISEPVAHVTYNPFDMNDLDIYILTGRNQMIRCNSAKLNRDAQQDSDKAAKRKRSKTPAQVYLSELVANTEPIEGISKDVKINGLVIISREICILYDHDKMYKMDTSKNQVINDNGDYPNISLMSNHSMFRKPTELLIISAAAS